MKKIFIAVIAFTYFGCAENNKAGKPVQKGIAAITDDEQYARNVNKGLLPDSIKKSVPRLATVFIDSNQVAINYFSPGVRARFIWGGLVPYEQVWVTGAHSATKISFTKDVLFGQTKIAARSYAIFTIPGKEEWIFILNKNYQQHLADDYKETEDVLRIKIKPEVLKDTVQRLNYEIKPHGEGTASIQMSWELIQITVPFLSTHHSSIVKDMPVTGKKLTGLHLDNNKDIVCYMPVTAGITDTFTYQKKLYGFCSAECKALFVGNPKQYFADTKQ